MTEEGKKAVPAETPTAGRVPKKKKAWPTNCAQSNKRIRRKNWYYRDGKYFANKQCFKLYKASQAASAATSAESAPLKSAAAG